MCRGIIAALSEQSPALLYHLHFFSQPFLEISKQINNNLVLMFLVQLHIRLHEMLHYLVSVFGGKGREPMHLAHSFLKK